MTARNDLDSGVRLRLILALAVVTPLGFATKLYAGPAEKWVATHAGGTLYVVFWCLLVAALRPRLSPWIISAAVLAITSALEFLQLWHPAPLQAIRSTWLGHALIGSVFQWSDFPYYVAGALLAAVVIRAFQGRGGAVEEQITPQWDDPKPGYRWPVAVAQPVAAPADRVWEVISTPGNLERCHPFCAENPVQVWPGERSRDEVHYLSGWVLERRFCRWIEGVGYDLEIGRRGGRTSFVSWRIKPIDASNCILSIAIYPDVLQNSPAAIRWLPHFLRLRPMLRRYLSSVVQGFEWYVIRGTPVPRNQFGSHPWFSVPRTEARAP